MQQTSSRGSGRRAFLQAGAASLFGLNLAPSFLLAGHTSSAAVPTVQSDVSLIIVWLKGGLSTIDTFDLKPHAPPEIRGEFRPISTSVPGIEICEHLPRMAKQMDKISLIRSFGHRNSDHEEANHYMLTGYHPVAGFNKSLAPNNQRPAHGAVISRKLGSRGAVPSYVCVPRMASSAGSAYLGPAAAPFTIESNPASPDFTVPDVVPPAGLSARRATSRNALLTHIDRFDRSLTTTANARAQAVSQFRQSAFALTTSSAAKQAFDLQSESERLRDEYGRHTLGQSCLMARRLVEGGVRCVHIDALDWDTHDKNFVLLKKEMLPMLDSAISSLFRDLSDRGLLQKTMVVVAGEFGRTPRINSRAGRDHWGPSFTVAVGGGGLHGGRIVGASDSHAERPATKPHGPEDLAATLFSRMGINPDEEFITPEGRPVKIVNDGRVIHDLL
jgi:hypothetical protein